MEFAVSSERIDIAIAAAAAKEMGNQKNRFIVNLFPNLGSVILWKIQPLGLSHLLEENFLFLKTGWYLKCRSKAFPHISTPSFHWPVGKWNLLAVLQKADSRLQPGDPGHDIKPGKN